MNMRSRRTVLLGVVAIAAVVFIGGMAAAWFSRNDTICKDGKPPVRQRAAPLQPTEFQCHNGQIVTK